MSRFLLTLLLVFGCIVPVIARAEGDEHIDQYVTQIMVDHNGDLAVLESVAYDFGDAQRHGIFRTIPLGGYFDPYRLQIFDIKVTDARGSQQLFSTKKSGTDIIVKIGDPNQTITGKHTYIISYKVANALRFFKTHTELYWNAVGTQWPVPITHAEAVVYLPEGVDAGQVDTRCFKGFQGDVGQCESVSVSSTSVPVATFTASDFVSGEGMTIALSVPPGLFQEPSLWQRMRSYMWAYKIIVLPLIVLLVLLWQWFYRGRDPKGRGTIITQFDPPTGTQPAEVGALIGERVQSRDLSAEIIFLATRGHLKIIREEKGNWWQKHGDYTLKKLDKSEEGLVSYQKQLLEALFVSGAEVNLLEIAKTFTDKRPLIIKSIFNGLTEQKYFSRNPDSVRFHYLVVGVVIFCAGFFIKSLFGIGLLIAGGLIVLFGQIMPARTRKGVEAREHILGFKSYLMVAEKARLEFHNAPALNPTRFDELLPYAMALGVEQAWAQQFASIYQASPSWYVDSAHSTFNSALLVQSLGDFNAQTSTALSVSSHSSSGFGGGGFSGGGGGGGGGGSW